MAEQLSVEEQEHLLALLRAVIAYDDANRSDLPLTLLTEIRLAIGAPA